MGFIILSLLLVFVIGMAAVFWLGSGRMIFPKRRALEQRHLDLLEAPHDYGMKLEAIEVTTEDGFPLQGFIASPIAPEQLGKAVRTRRMLDRLHEKGIRYRGEIRGTVILMHGRGG